VDIDRGHDATQTRLMKGKVCLVTGAATGMGKIAARELAGLGAELILVDNDAEQGGATAEELAKLTGNSSIRFIDCDIASLSQVRTLAARVNADYARLDVLINNAGLVSPEYRLTAEGHELHMATHHLGHFLLTRLLLDKLAQSAPARIIVIASDGHKAARQVDWDDLNNAGLWKGRQFSNNAGFMAYARSKLCAVLTTRALARRLDPRRITVNAVSPGYFVGTDIYRNMRGVSKLGVKMFRPFFTDPEKAAKTYVFLATSPEVQDVTGKYWEYCAEKACSPAAMDDAVGERLWDWTCDNTDVSPELGT